MAYITVAEVKVYLGIPALTTGDDALLTLLIAASQQAIDLYYHRTFEAASDTTRYFDAIEDVSGKRLNLDRDLCAITTVTNGNSVVVSGSNYTTFPRNETPYYALQLKGSSGLSWQYTSDPENAISVLGRWTYSITPPNAVIQLCKWLTATMYKGKDNVTQEGDSGLASESETLLEGNLPPDVKMLMGFIPRRAVF